MRWRSLNSVQYLQPGTLKPFQESFDIFSIATVQDIRSQLTIGLFSFQPEIQDHQDRMSDDHNCSLLACASCQTMADESGPPSTSPSCWKQPARPDRGCGAATHCFSAVSPISACRHSRYFLGSSQPNWL